MNHIYIFALIVNLLVGSFVFFFIDQVLKKRNKKYLISLKFFIIGFNTLILAYFASKYFSLNLINIDSKYLINVFILFLFFISEFFVGYFLYKTVCFLMNCSISKLLIRVYFFYGILFLGLYLNSYLNFLSVPFEKNMIDMVWELSINVFIIFQLIFLLWYSYRFKFTQNSIRPFGGLFLTGFVFYLMPGITYYIFGIGIGKYTDPFVLLFINLCPWIWIHFFYLKQTIEINPNNKNKFLFNTLNRKFDISKREFEIIECIMLGKSNREMCDILFISFHTVKNHIYKIFKKMEVNSRSQLINLINNDLDR